MALVALEFGIHPWDLAQLDLLQRWWLEHVAVWSWERRRERDQQMLEAMARIMGAKH